MTSYTWTATVSGGDWGAPSGWSPGNGPPGGSSSGIDDAVLAAAAASYAVTIGSADIFDIDTLTIAGTSPGNTTGLDISGALFANQLAYNGSGNDALIDVKSGGLLLVRTNLTATASETMTIAGGEVELGSSIFDGINIGTSKVTFAFANVDPDTQGSLFEINSSHFRTGETARQTITNFANGDTIQFDGANFTGDTYTYAGTTLTVLNGSTTVLTMNHLSAAPGTNFAFSGEFINAVCFAAGTRILTASGERTVESLRPGDLVCIRLGEELRARPVKWIGQRRIDLTKHPRPQTVAPVRIARDAIADGAPHRDLLVSPDHAIFVDRKLICARQLINGTTIRQEVNRTSVEYFHVELESHAILLAEGLPTESYLDTGNRGFFGNPNEYLVLHPDLADEADCPTREAASCEPFVWQEASVRPVWQQLADRAAMLGRPASLPDSTNDPELHIVAAGRSIRPLACDSGRHVFLLPPGVVEARIRSRAGSPGAVRPWLADSRCLGVNVARIVLRGASEVAEMAVDDPRLSLGWWAVERSGGTLHRWTDGDAVLPLPGCQHAAILEICLGGSDLAYGASGVSRAA